MVKYLSENWFIGTYWLTNPERWSEGITTDPSPETERETKIIKEVLPAAVIQNYSLLLVIKKFIFLKTMRITAWLLQFSNNCIKEGIKRIAPFPIEELQESTTTWMKRIHNEHPKDMKIADDKAKLQLEKNQSGMLVCRGPLQGNHPTYIPPNNEFAEKLVMNAHLKTLHGGVA